MPQQTVSKNDRLPDILLHCIVVILTSWKIARYFYYIVLFRYQLKIFCYPTPAGKLQYILLHCCYPYQLSQDILLHSCYPYKLQDCLIARYFAILLLSLPDEDILLHCCYPTPAGRLLGLCQLPQDQEGDPPVGEGDHHHYYHLHVHHDDHLVRIRFYIMTINNDTSVKVWLYNAGPVNRESLYQHWVCIFCSGCLFLAAHALLKSCCLLFHTNSYHIISTCIYNTCVFISMADDNVNVNFSIYLNFWSMHNNDFQNTFSL